MVTAQSAAPPRSSDSADPTDSELPPGLLGVAKLLLCWWWAFLPTVMLAVAIGVFFARDIGPEYVVERSMLVVGSNEVRIVDEESGEIEIENVNPLISLGSSFNTVASIMSIAMSDPEVFDQLHEEGLSTDVEVLAGSRSPVMLIRVYDSDDARAAATADRVVEMTAEELTRRQDALGAPEEERVFVESISGNVVFGPDYQGRNFLLLGTAAAGVAVGGGFVLVLEGLRRLKRSRQTRVEEFTPRPELAAGASSTSPTPVAARPDPVVVDRGEPELSTQPATSNGDGLRPAAAGEPIDDATTRLVLPLESSAPPINGGGADT